ncbi:lipopolysaccharide biosynthesis protein [Vibrio sp. 10N.261.52.F3]|uniref:lipopolysaccharide biosynthesis protein n=1 Tax=Vibrio sp. 10N.261.52.F3 TaxID=3229683 RepID=UPI003550CDD9
MTEQTVEQKFQQLKQSLEPKQFNSIEFLTAKAEQIEAEDSLLAKRILTRVANLKRGRAGTVTQDNQKQNDKKLGDKEQAPKTVKSKSLEKKTPIDKAVESTVESKGKTNLSNQKLAPQKAALFEFISNNLFILLVVLPTAIFAFYQNFWATERYDSQALVIVQQPDGMATMDASMALLTGLGGSSSMVSDTELVKAYIYSNDMLSYLDESIQLREHYSQKHIDFFSKMFESDSREDFVAFYEKHISVYIDSKSNVVHINAQAFNPEFSRKLTQTIVERSEWYINSIGHQLAEAQLEFIKGEHQLVQDTLELAQRNLLQFQQRYNLLDPTAEGMAMQQIAYTLEGQISIKEAELKGLKGVMSKNAPQVVSLENELNALRHQLINERNKLSQDNELSIPVSEILAGYADLKIKMELALKAYTSSQISLEKARVEAYRQLKFLIVVERATKPEDNKYPDAFYNVTLFALVAAMLFAIGRIIFLVIQELK